jgi:hypothetical protein
MTLQDLAKYIVEEVKTATNGATDLSEKLAMLDDIPLMSEAVPPARLAPARGRASPGRVCHYVTIRS